MHTKDMLADELMRLGLMDMSLQARGGYYHDFLSPLATPELQLMGDLVAMAARLPDRRDAILALRERVMNGDFDATSEESDAWAESEEGQDTFHQLIREKKP